MGYAELIQRKSTESKIIGYSDEVIKASLRARDLINQILTYSRNIKTEFQNIDVYTLVKGIVPLIRASTPSSIIISEYLEEERYTIKADLTQMHQVIMNICTNGIHAMGNDKGKLDITMAKIVLEKHSDIFSDCEGGDYIDISISDSGTGIAPELKDKIFDPYFTTKEVGEGSGLGLSIVDGIVKTHQGMVKVDSKLGEGTTVHIYLPLVKEEALSFINNQGFSPEKSIQSKNILVVDDEIFITRIFQAQLEDLGHVVHSFNSPERAFSYFKEHSALIDLVITDHAMPKITGSELIKMIKSIDSAKPVILCTGYTDLLKLSDEKGSSYHAVLKKPVTLEEIVRELDKLFKNQIC
jgi:CheY-like chemotaxis protein